MSNTQRRSPPSLNPADLTYSKRPTRKTQFKEETNIPGLTLSSKKRTPDGLRKLQKFSRNKSIKDTFAPKIPDYVSLWPRSEILACYFQFIGLLASALALEYAQFNFQDFQTKGISNISLAGDKLTRTMLILQFAVIGIGSVIRLGWPSKREEITAAAMGVIMSIVVLIVDGLNDKESGKFLVASVAVALVCGILSIALYPPVQPYDNDNDFDQELNESEIHPLRKLSKMMNVGTFVAGSMAATRYTNVG